MEELLPAPRLGSMLKVVDRAQHPSTPPEEKQVYMETLNRLCGNQMFSDVIAGYFKLRPGEVRKLLEPIDVEALARQTEIAGLLEQIDSLEAQNRELARRIAALEQEVHEDVGPRAENGFYTMDTFVTALIAAKGGRSYGWKNDYVAATHNTPGARPVNHQDIQKWQKDQKVPEYAFDQLKILVFPKRVGKKSPRWTEAEYRKFAGWVNANPKTPNAELARMCTEEFKRGEVNDNMVKGAKFRAYRRGLIQTIEE